MSVIRAGHPDCSWAHRAASSCSSRPRAPRWTAPGPGPLAGDRAVRARHQRRDAVHRRSLRGRRGPGPAAGEEGLLAVARKHQTLRAAVRRRGGRGRRRADGLPRRTGRLRGRPAPGDGRNVMTRTPNDPVHGATADRPEDGRPTRVARLTVQGWIHVVLAANVLLVIVFAVAGSSRPAPTTAPICSPTASSRPVPPPTSWRPRWWTRRRAYEAMTSRDSGFLDPYASGARDEKTFEARLGAGTLRPLPDRRGSEGGRPPRATPGAATTPSRSSRRPARPAVPKPPPWRGARPSSTRSEVNSPPWRRTSSSCATGPAPRPTTAVGPATSSSAACWPPSWRAASR